MNTKPFCLLRGTAGHADTLARAPHARPAANGDASWYPAVCSSTAAFRLGGVLSISIFIAEAYGDS